MIELLILSLTLFVICLLAIKALKRIETKMTLKRSKDFSDMRKALRKEKEWPTEIKGEWVPCINPESIKDDPTNCGSSNDITLTGTKDNKLDNYLLPKSVILFKKQQDRKQRINKKFIEDFKKDNKDA